MDLNSSKNLGGIGAILMFLCFIPYVGSIIALVGLILLMIGAKGLADYYREEGIFNNALYGVIAAIVGAIAFVSVVVFALVGFFSEIGVTLGWTSFADWSSLAAIDWQNAILGSGAMAWLGYIVLALAVLFIFAIIAAVFFRKSLGITASKSGIGLFGTAGTLIIVGAVLPVIGLVLLWISLLLIAVAFFQLKPQPATSPL